MEILSVRSMAWSLMLSMVIHRGLSTDCNFFFYFFCVTLSGRFFFYGVFIAIAIAVSFFLFSFFNYYYYSLILDEVVFFPSL